MIAASPGRNSLLSTKWIPWLGVIELFFPGSSNCCSLSEKTPVAFIIALERTSYFFPVIVFVACTPCNFIPSFKNPSTAK
jgi:hypothetical protein